MRGPGVTVKDGTCKPDADGDGEPDEGEDEGTFSGGDDCATPPACSGDNIMCGQARIEWRIMCNTQRKRNISGGNGCGTDIPICTGENCDPVEYGQLLQQWRMRCATEALLAKPTGGGGADMTGTNQRLDAIKKYLDGDGQSLPSAPAMPFQEAGSEPSNWSSGLGSGACPAPASTSVSFMGVTQDISMEFDPICQFADMFRPVFISLCMLFGVFIIAGVRR